MRLQPLICSKELGFTSFPVGYAQASIDNGRYKFAKSYLEGDITCKRLMFVEQINAPTAIGGTHWRQAISVIIYSTKAILDIIQDPFTVQVTNEPFHTEKTPIKAWLRVGGQIGETGSSYQPMLIVRDSPEVSLTRVDTYFKHVIAKIERDNRPS